MQRCRSPHDEGVLAVSSTSSGRHTGLLHAGRSIPSVTGGVRTGSRANIALWDGAWKTPPPHMCYSAEFGRPRSNGKSVIKIRLKFLTLRLSPLRSLDVIGTDTHWLATCDVLLMFRSNHEVTSYRFRDKRRFLSKIVFFQSPCI